jgi:hypothetical protein
MFAPVAAVTMGVISASIRRRWREHRPRLPNAAEQISALKSLKFDASIAFSYAAGWGSSGCCGKLPGAREVSVWPGGFDTDRRLVQRIVCAAGLSLGKHWRDVAIDGPIPPDQAHSRDLALQGRFEVVEVGAVRGQKQRSVMYAQAQRHAVPAGEDCGEGATQVCQLGGAELGGALAMQNGRASKRGRGSAVASRSLRRRSISFCRMSRGSAICRASSLNSFSNRLVDVCDRDASPRQ